MPIPPQFFIFYYFFSEIRAFTGFLSNLTVGQIAGGKDGKHG